MDERAAVVFHGYVGTGAFGVKRKWYEAFIIERSCGLDRIKMIY